MVETVLSSLLFLLTFVFFVAVAVVAAFFAGFYGLKLIDRFERWYKSKE